VARRPHDPDFAVFRLWPERTGLFLDVGANAGMSALAFRLYNRRSPILSIEPNPLNEPDLRLVGRLIRGFDYALCGASDEAGSLTLYTPVVGGVPITGEAALSRATVEGRVPHILAELGVEPRAVAVQVVETTVGVRPLDELDLAPSFVKVDVQGWEVRALEGMRRTLERHRPVLVVENGECMDEVRGLLGALAYTAHTYHRPSGSLRDCDAEEVLNVVFAPH
jgi:FkbM family methyltransferase